ncbi:MAG: hypothetical protein IKO77_01085 [Bacteroidales bacterium]|nr:hypothetical protein [Bacteroidales bacterium]
MRKIFSILAVLTAFLAVSCTNEPEGSLVGKAKVIYTIDGPSQIATKAMGTITSAYTLYYEVRLWDGSVLGEKLTGEGLSGSKTVAADQWPATVSFDLARGKQYKILFWAQSVAAPEGLFDASDLAAVAIDYSKMAASNEECDAFSGFDVITPAGATAASATLTRPFALVNLGTSDATQFKTASGGCTVGDVKVTVAGTLASSFNVATGEAGTGSATSFAPNAAPIDAFDAKTLIVNETAFNYLSAVYVLPAAGSEVIEVAYIIKDNNDADITTLEVTNVPVKTNYRTNITGKLLTGTTTYNISVDQAFTGETDKNATPFFSSIADLNTFFATKIATGPNDPDNGDIFPETVIVTAIPDGDATTITLPNDTLSVAINILVPYSEPAGLTIAYPVAEGAKHSQNVYFNMAGLSKLTANLPDTHLEVVCGSDIDLSDVHTSAGTFVVQEGARVGVLNIKQGNAFVAGSIDSLKVNPSATSDGQASGAGNAVQVFLAKESAVEKIFLNSKTDVVVEQPKDHIEVEATERKVAVYVNDGAANSTATAQNGGVIYVEANVPCTVTADGTSTAESETGNVSSTVIINETATGSSVVATNGASVDLTANGNCSATAEGVAEGQGSEPDTPSTITVKEVKDDTIVIDGSTSDGGEIDTTPDTSGSVKYYVAQIVGGDKYESLYDAVAAAASGATVEMIANSTETMGFTLTKSLTIDLCEFTVTYDSGTGSVDTGKFPNSRAIKIGGSEAIAVTVENGTIVVGNNVYGPFRIENGNADVVLDGLILNNSMAYGLGTKIVDAHSVAISNTVVNSVVGGGIEKGCDCPTTLTNVTVNQTEEDTQHPWISTAISTEYGGPLTVVSGSYSGKVAAYLFSSGGTMNINGGSFTGNEAAIRVQNNTQESGWTGASTINITAGTFVGPLILDAWGATDPVPNATMTITGGTFTTTTGQGALFQVNGNYSHLTITGGSFAEDPSTYVAPGYKAIYDSQSGYYVVVPYITDCIVYTPGIEPVLSMEQPNVDYPDSPSNYEVSFNGQSFYLQLNRTEVTPVAYSFEDAVNHAQAGQVIRLTSDVTVGSLAIPADVAIDFAGHTLTADQLSCKTSGGKFILKQSDQSNPYKVSFVGELEDAEIRGGSYLFDPTEYTPNGVGVVIPGQGEYAGGYYVPSVPEPKVFYANNEIVQQLGGLTIGKIPGTYNYNGWVLMYNPDGQRYNPYNTIGIENGLYAFQADFNENENTTNAYQDWYADYVIYYDKAVNYEQKEIQEWDGPHTYDCPTAGLWGSYGGMTYAILMGENVPANYKCPLLGMVNWGWEYWKIRSDVKTFLCGPTNHSMANVGTTATVELRLYKSQPTMEGINAPGYKDYITVGRYVHPLDNPSLTPATDGN